VSRWPACVRDLPECPVRKLPAPFAAEVEPDGRVNFTALDPYRKQDIIRYRLCGICGKPLTHWIVFLGDWLSTQGGDDGVYVDPPMHEACCLASIELCPYIARERVPRRPPRPQDVMISPAGTFEGPKRPWVMAYTRDFKIVVTRAWGDAEASQVFRPAKIARTRWFAYGPDGLIRETEVPR
jgi:hypothetical protein